MRKSAIQGRDRGTGDGCKVVMGGNRGDGDAVAIGDLGCITSCVGGRGALQWKRRREKGEGVEERRQGVSMTSSSSIWGRPTERCALPTKGLRSSRDPLPGGRSVGRSVSCQEGRERWRKRRRGEHAALVETEVPLALDYSHPCAFSGAASPPTWIEQTRKKTGHFLPRYIFILVDVNVCRVAPHPGCSFIVTCRKPKNYCLHFSGHPARFASALPLSLQL